MTEKGLRHARFYHTGTKRHLHYSWGLLTGELWSVLARWRQNFQFSEQIYRSPIPIILLGYNTKLQTSRGNYLEPLPRDC
jgi:hypothetical protein